MKTTLSRLAAGLVLATIATSCTTVKISSWMDPQFAGRTPGKTLVVGVAESESIRRRYEDMFVESLTSIGIDATASAATMPGEDLISESRMREHIAKSGAASVIVTRVLGEKDKVNYSSPAVYPSHYGSYYGFYSASYGYATSPGYAFNYTETMLETTLYDVASGKLVWAGTKTITDDRSDKKNMTRVIEAVIEDLQKNELLPAAGK
jgi:hypothetical protein